MAFITEMASIDLRGCATFMLTFPVYLLASLLVCLQLDKARCAYHKVSRKEHAAREREAHAQGNPDVSIDKQKKLQEDRELVQQEAEKVSPGAAGVQAGPRLVSRIPLSVLATSYWRCHSFAGSLPAVT